MVRSESVILFDVYGIDVFDLHFGIDLGIIVSDEELDEFVFFDFLALDPDTLETRLDGRETFEISFLHRFGFAALFTDGHDRLLGGDSRPETAKYPKETRLSDTPFLIVIEWDDDVEILFHNLCHINEIGEEVDIPVRLLLEEVILLFDGEILEFHEVSFDVDLE